MGKASCPGQVPLGYLIHQRFDDIRKIVVETYDQTTQKSLLSVHPHERSCEVEWRKAFRKIGLSDLDQAFLRLGDGKIHPAWLHPALKCSDKYAWIDWLGHMIVHTSFGTSAALFFISMCGQSDDWQGVRAPVATNMTRGFQTIHFGHLNVHQHG